MKMRFPERRSENIFHRFTILNDWYVKSHYQSANPRDLIAFQTSHFAMLPHIKCILSDMQTPLLKELYEELDTLEDLCKLVSDSIREDPPIAMKEGGNS